MLVRAMRRPLEYVVLFLGSIATNYYYCIYVFLFLLDTSDKGIAAESVYRTLHKTISQLNFVQR